MKTITLWQPWASLLALGYKTVETRSWPTNHRGLLAIHAAGRPCDPQIFYQYPFQRVFLLPEVGIAHPSDLPLGAILAIVDLTGVTPGEELAPPGRTPTVGWLQLAFGDFTPGRFAWLLKDRRPLDVPIPARGKQGLWDWTPPPGFELPAVQEQPGEYRD